MDHIDKNKHMGVIKKRYEADVRHRKKMSDDHELRYTTVWHAARQKFGLTPNEYCLAAYIDGLSKKDARYSRVPGWCYASKDFLGKALGFTRQGIHKMINKLIDKELVERDLDTNYLRATPKWLNEIEYYKNRAQR